VPNNRRPAQSSTGFRVLPHVLLGETTLELVANDGVDLNNELDDRGNGASPSVELVA
jgi:hypothetical protein